MSASAKTLTAGAVGSTGGSQPGGGWTSIMVPHLGQARICPISEGLATFNFAAHDLQMMKKTDKRLFLTNFSMGGIPWQPVHYRQFDKSV